MIDRYRMSRSRKRAPSMRIELSILGLGLILLGTSPVSAETGPLTPLADPAESSIVERLWSPARLSGQPGEERITRDSRASTRLPEAAPRFEHATFSNGFDATIRRADLPAGERLVALPFDLCEGEHERTGYQAGIVDYLRGAGVSATFFAGGKWMQSHPERMMQLMADPLFEVGNHSWKHENLRTADSETIEQEISWTQLEYAALRAELARRARTAGVDEAALDRIPEVPRLFRFPYGTCRPEALEAVRRNGLKAIQWDVVTGDPAPRQTANGIVATVLHQVRPGSIVIFHANGRGHGTVDAI